MRGADHINHIAANRGRTTSFAEALAARAPDRRSTIASVANPARVARLALYLPEHDRALLRAIYADGVPLSVVAQLRGQSERDCRRALHRLLQRINHPAFTISIHHSASLSRRGTLVARACFVEGLTMRQAAARLHLSIHIVRRERLRMLAIVQYFKLADRLSRLDSKQHTPSRQAA